MSQWATLDAKFALPNPKWLNAESWLFQPDQMPTGSESGPTAHQMDPKTISVYGRLRDVSDYNSPAVLAWFVKVCEHGLVDTAELTWDVDSGPRYRWEWDTEGLRRLKGILE